MLLVLLLASVRAAGGQGVLPVITCTELPRDTGGAWQCSPPVQAGHGYHVNTECSFR